ncbi:hypothetical protein RF11_01057 [Thelohanellus kitauei]|uniref:Tc1-like transposase DDE domain-containing protein n=1 Tax=Thelohanellus kitauei TaxID=669202 RepID=A0A0C2JHD0_THEKT|nr:hypothetical protein RF11_01057 [Thelohanellus kitauei]
MLTRLVPIFQNTGETIQKRYDYAISFFEVYLDFITMPLHMSEDVIYIDETGFNLHLRRKFGRSLNGKRVAITVSSSKGVNIRVCAAMHNGELVNFRSRIGAYNSNEFIQFLTQLFERIGTGKKHLLMDNVRFHNTENVTNGAESRGHDIIFLPPYSPQLNPIELVFSKWKSIVIG